MASNTPILILLALSVFSVNAAVQNCTSNTCDLKTCTNTSTPCQQYCYTSQCRMSCSSLQGCRSECKEGNCSRMSCDVPITKGIYSFCEQICKGDCADMSCRSRACRPTCVQDNCKISCYGAGHAAGCFAFCLGKGCQIDVHSYSGEVQCSQGFCKVRFSKGTSGSLFCPVGGCTYTCAKGQTCRVLGPCPNCTGPVYVDDPFPTSSALRHSFGFSKCIGQFVFCAVFVYLVNLFRLA